MKRLNIVALAVVAVLIAVSAAGADHGRRSSGPFCIGNDNAGQNAGVIRSVAIGQKCRSYEHGAVGVAIPCPTLTNAKGHTCGPTRGPRGAAGKNGTNGKDGTNGTNGKDSTVPGPPGPAGTSVKGDKGDPGAASTVPGPPGPPGPPGAASTVPGPSGPAGAPSTVPGPPGAPGKDGKDGSGLGDGYRWLCYDGNSGHGMADGGTGAAPNCNNGTKLAFKVVTIGAAIVNP